VRMLWLLCIGLYVSVSANAELLTFVTNISETTV
jgi:hypothetical protein